MAAASQQPLAATSAPSPHQQPNLFDLSRYRQYNLAQQFFSQQQGAVTKLLGKQKFSSINQSINRPLFMQTNFQQFDTIGCLAKLF